ncbi:DUF2505 domain-containing protein [Nocardioides rubriscoriae]|uniref:DUF2505 domain-containing protein n=1 Tax=Nocardioides rubriscoriae TaxID=642762 RepID=UPI0011DFE376|nr:DUF2505 domain-containing protein [Nocardioides rubriscoriae]
MPKSIRYEMAYDAPVETVAAMLADPTFREDVCRFQGVTQVEATVEVAGDTKKVKVDQMQPTAGVPSFAKKIVGDETNIVQEESWSSLTHADITVTIPGKPGDMSGTVTLAPTDAGGTLEAVDLTIKVKIPLVAGKLESLIGDLLLKALKAEYKVGRDYLAR